MTFHVYHFVTVFFFPSSSAEATAQNRSVQVNMKCRYFFFSHKLWLKSFESLYKGHRNQGFNQEVAWQWMKKKKIKWRTQQFWDAVLKATIPSSWRPHLHPLCCLLVAITMQVQRVKIQWHSCRYRDVITPFKLREEQLQLILATV